MDGITPATIDVPPTTPSVADVSVAPAADRPASVAGAGIAAAICLLIAVFGWAIQADSGWLIGVLGLPAATLFAWRMAPRVVAASTSSQARWMAVGLAVRVIVLTDVVTIGLFAVLFVVSSFGQGSGESIIWALVVLFYGLVALVIVGIPLLVVVLPAALLWAALVRTAMR